MTTCSSVVGMLNRIIVDLNLKGCVTYKEWLCNVSSLDDCYYMLELVKINCHSLEQSECERRSIIIDKLKSDIFEKLEHSFDCINFILFDK